MLSGNFAEMTTSSPFRVLLHAADLRHGTDGFTSPPKEGDHTYASFNSVQVSQSTSKQSSFPCLFRIGNLISFMLLTEGSTLFPKEKQASKFLI